MGRFEFLQAINPELYSLCQSAAKNIQDDLDVAMFKARQALEVMLRELDAAMESSHRNLNSEITYLYRAGVLPLQIKNSAHDVRKYANDCVHHQKIRSEYTPNDILDKLLHVIIWYVAIYEKKPCSQADFVQDSDRRLYCELTGEVYAAAESGTREASLDKLVEQSKVADEQPDSDRPADSEFCDEESLFGEYPISDSQELPEEFVKDVFESDEEYRDRIRALEPMCIGTGILLRRHIDKYTNLVMVEGVHFIKHEGIKAHENLNFVLGGDLLYEDSIEGKLAAALDVRDGQIYFDYSRVFFCDQMGNLLPMYAICWERLPVESAAEQERRMEQLPVLPVGICRPDKLTYSRQDGTMDFQIKPYAYIEDVLALDKLKLSMSRDAAKEFCMHSEKYMLYAAPHYVPKDNKSYLADIHIESDDGEIVYDCQFNPVEIKQIFGCETDNLSAYVDEQAVEKQQKNMAGILQSKVGDTVEFGKNFLDKGKDAPLQWEILAIEAKKILLLSKYAIAACAFNQKEGAVSWEISDIRKFLNEEFYDKAFSAWEKQAIKESLVVPEKNMRYGTELGDVACDRIFLLSAGEVERFMPHEANRKRAATAYALKNGICSNGDDTCRWWLRNQGHSNDNIVEVDYNGRIHYYGMSAEYDRCGLCPAMWIKAAMT